MTTAILAGYDMTFQPLSKRHEILIARTETLLTDYAAGRPIHPTYAVIGTFGAGKTQLLFSLHRSAIEKGLVPIHILAEDLFDEVIRGGRVFTQGDVAALVDHKMQQVLDALRSAGSAEEANKTISKLVDPRGTSSSLWTAVSERFAGSSANLKAVLFVDELEGQYRTLQERVQTPGDRSPLREAFEVPKLKFFALAPAGIYEMGGADQTRAVRLVVPAADVKYVRANLVPNVGSANACWWLARGKARHLFKACTALKDIEENVGAAQARRILRDELDPIGQPPTEVPPAVTEGLPPAKLPSLLNLAPVVTEARRSYVVECFNFDEGEAAQKLSDAFGIGTDVALVLAEYLRTTASALSDQEGRAYVPDNDLAELLCLALDHLLEYEYGNPDLVKQMADVLNLYEKFRNEPAAVYGSVGLLWERRQSTSALPLSMAEVRRCFPFPLMNPIVKGHDPGEMRKRWEGKGLPLWKWENSGLTCCFFASGRDCLQFLDTDEFTSTVLPDGASALCLFPPGEKPATSTGLAQWFIANGKLGIEELPQLLADFLMSGTGELDSPAGDLAAHKREWINDKADVILSRKAQIYSDALQEIILASIPRPKTYFSIQPPDAETIWGNTQVADRTVAVVALALAWADLTAEQKTVLARLRDLFRSAKEGRSSSDFSKLKPRPGTVSMADDVLPRYGRNKALADSPAVHRLQEYWPDEKRTDLVRLAALLQLEKFIKLASDENEQRLLESLWRAVRKQFNFKERLRTLEDCISIIDGEVLPALDGAGALERRAKEALNVTGIEFEDNESVIKASEAFRQLSELLKEFPAASVAAPLRAVLELYGSSLDVSKQVRTLNNQIEAARRSITRLEQAAENLRKNFWEYPKAVSYLNLSEDGLHGIIKKEREVGRSCTLPALAQEAASRAEKLDEMNEAIRHLHERLQALDEAFLLGSEGGDA